MNSLGLRVAAVAGLISILAAACAPSATGGPAATPTVSAEPQVQEFDDMGRTHLAEGQAPPRYNSNPPTSGPHSPRVMAWGIHDRLSPKEVLIHNMEHGGVVVWYNCKGGPKPLTNQQCDELRNQLRRLVQFGLDNKKLIVMGPYEDMPNRIALTSWGKLDTFDDFNALRVAKFIDTYERAFNPEGF